MKKHMGAALLALMSVPLAGCSAPAPTTYVSPKKEFIQTLEYRAIVVIMRDVGHFGGSWSDEDIRGAVDVTCNGFANGESADEVRSKVATKFGGESTSKAFEVQQVISTSVGIRCEEYKAQQDKIKRWDVSPKR